MPDIDPSLVPDRFELAREDRGIAIEAAMDARAARQRLVIDGWSAMARRLDHSVVPAKAGTQGQSRRPGPGRGLDCARMRHGRQNARRRSGGAPEDRAARVAAARDRRRQRLAKVEITGVCGADWPIYTGALAQFAPPPLIPGHEIVARIAKIGDRAARRWGVQEGDRIVMEEYAPCGRCDYCLSGRYYICNGMKMEKMYGFTSLERGSRACGAAMPNISGSIRRR